MSDKLKVGIIGMGAIGNVHANAFKKSNAAEVFAICDVDPAKLSSCGDSLDVENRFNNYTDLLNSDVEAVIVGVGNTLHHDVAIAALKAGKHVLLEKPMAMNAEEASRIAEVAEVSGKVLQIGMVYRQDPGARVVKDYIDKGLFGKIYHMRVNLIRRRGIPGLGGWFTTKALSGGGPMIDIGVHWFDLAMWLSGSWNPTSVSAKTYAEFGPRMADYKYVGMWAGPPRLDGKFDVEDFSTGFVRFGTNMTMVFNITWAANIKDEGSIDIMGTDGGARIMNQDTLKIFTEHNGRPANIEPLYNKNVNNFEEQAKAFASACMGKCKPAVTASEGVTIMRLIDSIYASSKADKEIEIKQ